jgi:hypothetical protein
MLKKKNIFLQIHTKGRMISLSLNLKNVVKLFSLCLTYCLAYTLTLSNHYLANERLNEWEIIRPNVFYKSEIAQTIV